MNNITESLVSIAAAIIGVTILAVLVSRRSDTANVIHAAASGFGNVLVAAASPLGGNVTPDLHYPSVGGVYSPLGYGQSSFN